MNENHIDILAKIAMNENNKHFDGDKWYEEEELQPHKITLRINQDREDFGTAIKLSNKKKLFADLERDNYIVRHQINPRRIAYHLNYVKLMNDYLDYLIENGFNINRYHDFDVDEIKKLKKVLNKKKAVIYKRDKSWTKHALRKVSTLYELKLIYQKINASLLAVNLLRGYGRVNVASNMRDVFSKITDGLWRDEEWGINGKAIRDTFTQYIDRGEYFLEQLEDEKL